ncbi:MAG: tRNA lysidine(34) synthetase TilS [Erysipelotrichaceae bacterium]|nr:tRNA lysidine(34) synthetase TilS [Erysipelotrichaceae bacterium]
MIKKKSYLVACSGGSDSMALLDMFKDKYNLKVCHINYHKRDTAKRDENIVRKYCKNNNIEFIKYDYKDEEKGNFQDLARVFRYKCFANCVNKYNLDGVLVGHHLDDLLETYLLQKERKSSVTYYGLKTPTIIMDVKIIRPLLKYSKKELEEYCIKNNIEYGIDESNLTDHYKRNRIRHSKIEKMSKTDKQELLKEIKYKNYVQSQENKAVRDYIKGKTKFSYDEFMTCPYIKRLLRTLIKEDLSDKHLDEIIKALKSNKNIELIIDDKCLYKEYGYIEVCDKPVDYSYTINSLEYKKYPYFKLCKKGTSFEGVTVSKQDFPLTIRNVKEGDFISMRYGTKKVSRFFIDKKIETSKRKTWPIMLNKKGIAILVPEIGCNKDHYSNKHNLYMVK